MLTSYASKVLDSFESLGKMLENENGNLVIYDDPLKLVIKRERIEFYVDGEYQGFVDRSSAKLSDLVIVEAEMWLKALANLHFKRFSLRK
ncbi:MAG: hypothetical protein ACK401_06860 [Archaeoglobaceae archaeon]